MIDLKNSIRDVPDFPKPGIVFKDITTLLKDPGALKNAVEAMIGKVRDLPIDKVAAVESRGFIFAVPVAMALNAGFVPIRKPGKLPSKTVRETYALEYGEDSVEVHEDAIAPGDRVLIVDDLLATGGTVAATQRLVRRLGGEVSAVLCLIELTFLEGRKNLDGSPFHSLIQY